MKRYLVTGGTGFLGSALVRRLVREGHAVRILDNNCRGNRRRIHDVENDVELIDGDIRNKAIVAKACEGIDRVCHLAYINGTEYFYSMPELVLEVAVKGIINVIDACLEHHVPELLLASSSEVYQNPPSVPTNERAPLVIPDPQNPRLSYAGGKIISELIVIHYGKKHFERVLIVRPHNVYGPDMGWEHAIPQFILRMKELIAHAHGVIDFPIQGTGEETRAFIYVDDFIDGMMLVLERGQSGDIFHIGTEDEKKVSTLAEEIARYFGMEIRIVPGTLTEGSTKRRCPDTAKIRSLGFQPHTDLSSGLRRTADWYVKNAHFKERLIPRHPDTQQDQ